MDPSEPGRAERLAWAEEFLQESVFRSRARQAAGQALNSLAVPALAPQAGAAQRKGQCGLGESAAVDLDLSPRAAELFAQLWPAGLAAQSLVEQRAHCAAWVVRQDALDRERNHFLKAFRHKHGFDRRTYSPEQQALYAAGLAALDAQNEHARAQAARALLA